jgi:predicted Zn-dependent protease
MKLFLKGFLLTVSFLAIWWMLSQINWVSLFKIDTVTKKTEEKIGELFWDLFKNEEKETTDSVVIKHINQIVTRLCESNKIDRSYIKVHVLLRDDVNAFALPNGHLIIYSGLITQSDQQEELCGVIGHELAHIQLDHIMKKLVREVGLTALVSITTGGQGTETIKEIAKLLSSTAYDRKLEKEADLHSVQYLTKASINPEGLAVFLEKMAKKEGEGSRYLNWISTHPDSKERARYIRNASKKTKWKTKSVLTDSQWSELKEKLE